MEYALGERTASLTARQKRVLILVLMEYALGVNIANDMKKIKVLILVLMEYALGDTTQLLELTQLLKS